jgi:hypothetical protein
VDLPASAVEALKGHRHLCGVYVFCLPDGRPLTAGMTKHPLLRALRRYAHLSPEARERAVQELDRPSPQPRAALG